MGGRTVAERIVHGRELGLDIGFAEAHELKGTDHDLGVVVPDGAGGQLHAVADQIILIGVDRQRVDLAAMRTLKRLQAALRHGERVVAELQLAGLLADLIHREVDDPAELIALGIHMALDLRAEQLAQYACGLDGRAVLAGGQRDEAVLRQAELFDDLVLLFGDKLGDAADQLAVFVQTEPVGLAAGEHLGLGAELVDKLAGLVEVRHDDGLDGLPGKRLKAAVLQAGGVGQLEVDAQIRLVGTIAVHGLAERNAAERRRGGRLVLAVLREHRGQHILKDGKDVILRSEGHLHIQLIELAGAAVGTGVLIAEARRDLEIAVEAGGHEQLLELLRSLRQSIELAGMVAGRDEIVARTLGRGARQDRRGDLKEAALRHAAAQVRHDIRAQDDVLLDLRVAQVQIAVLQALIFVRLLRAVDLEGQRIVAAAAKHGDALRHDLDLTRGLLRILAGALADHAGHGDRGFAVDGLEGLHHLLRLNDDLRRAIEVAQDDKGQIAADLAHIFQPARQRDGLAGVGETKLAAVVRSRLRHGSIPPKIISLKSRSPCSARKFLCGSARPPHPAAG